MEDIMHVTAKGSSPFTLTNTNKLLRSYDGCDGLKTGSTSYAKYCLSATARRDGIRIISVVMTAPDSKTRFAEAGKLLNYGFSRCSIYYDGEMPKLSPVPVKGSIQTEVSVRYPDEFSYLSTTGEDFSQITREAQFSGEIMAPLEEGEEVGSLVYKIGEREIGRMPIVTAEEVEKAGYLDWVNAAWGAWMV